jgi:F-type H+-transporting ATPase subunit b
MEMLALDGGLMVWTLLTFACLFALLARYAFRPLRRILDEREAVIRRAMDEAAEAQREAERILEANRTELASAREETRRTIQEGHRIVAEMKRDARNQAREDARRIVDDAREEIQRDVRRGLDDLKSTVVNLSMRIARQVIRKNLDPAEHEALADDLLERLKQSRKP